MLSMARSHFLFSLMRSCQEGGGGGENAALRREDAWSADSWENRGGQEEEGTMTEQMSLKQKSYVEKQTKQYGVTSQKTLRARCKKLRRFTATSVCTSCVFWVGFHIDTVYFLSPSIIHIRLQKFIE